LEFLNKTKEIFKFIKWHNYAGDIMVPEKEDSRITVRLDQRLLDAIKSKAAETGESSSEIIRRAIEKYITDYPKIKNIVLSEQSTDEMGEKVTIRIEPDMLKKLTKITDETGKSISRLVREAINWFLSEEITLKLKIPKKYFAEVRRLIE